MSYVTVFAAAVPNNHKEDYLAHVRETAEIFKKHGAVQYLECWGSEVPAGELTSFPLAVKCEPDETVVVGFAKWASKTAHDQGMPKVMQEMREGMQAGTLPKPPFDGKRLIFGGFDVILEL